MTLLFHFGPFVAHFIFADLGQFFGVSAAAGQLSFATVSEWVDPFLVSGVVEKTFTGLFKQIAAVQGLDKLKSLYAESGLEFKDFLPPKSRNDPKYWESFLQSRGSTFASLFS